MNEPHFRREDKYPAVLVIDMLGKNAYLGYLVDLHSDIKGSSSTAIAAIACLDSCGLNLFSIHWGVTLKLSRGRAESTAVAASSHGHFNTPLFTEGQNLTAASSVPQYRDG